MNNFVDLLKRSFALWWRVKLLWPLGMLAALVGYGDATVGGNFNVSQQFSADSEADLPPWARDLAESPLVQAFIANPWPYIIGVIGFVLVWALVAALVGALAHGALIRVADVADQGYAASLGDGLRVGAARVAPLFLINLILALPVLVVVLGIAAVVGFSVVRLIASSEGGAGPSNPGALIASLLGLFFCVFGVIVLLWVVGLVLGVWARLAQRACVIEARGPIASLGRGWRLIVRNLGLTLLTWLLQGVLGGIVGFLLAIPAVALAFPLLLSVAQGGALPVGLIVALVLYAIVASVTVGGLLTAFNSTMWTVVYRAFVAREGVGEAVYGAPA